MNQDRAANETPRIKPLSERTPDEVLELIGTTPIDALVWNDLRRREPDWKPDFTGVDFRGRSLAGLDLSGADLSRAILRDVDATGADFTGIIVTATTDFSGMIDTDAKFDEPVRALIEMRKAASAPTLTRS